MSQATRLAALANELGQDHKLIIGYLFGVGGSLADLATTDKTSLTGAINALHALVVAAGSGLAIDDADANGSTTAVFSSEKILALIAAAQTAAATDAVSQITGSAPELLNVLSELAAALNNDPDFGTTVTNALSKRVRVDAAQTFTVPEQLQARNNIGAASAESVGNTEQDLVAAYNAGKA